MLKKLLSACVCLVLAAGTLRAQTEDRRILDVARKAMQTYDKAVITLAAVIKLEGGGREQEIKTQCIATIIDASGLAVTAWTNLNPIASLRVGGRPVPPSTIESQVQEVKYRLADGTEVTARVVLKDEDLDLAFLAPLKPLDKATQAKTAVVSMTDAAVHVEPLDLTIIINRASDDLNFIPVLALGRITAIVTTPRTCYLSAGGNFGLPVFDRQGNPLGIISRCIVSESSSGTMSRLVSPSNTPIILPASDVARLVPQAKEEAKKAAEAEKKAAEKKKTGGKKKVGTNAKADGKKAAEPRKK